MLRGGNTHGGETGEKKTNVKFKIGFFIFAATENKEDLLCGCGVDVNC